MCLEACEVTSSYIHHTVETCDRRRRRSNAVFTAHGMDGRDGNDLNICDFDDFTGQLKMVT